MENVKSVTRNPGKFVNYTKQTIETSPKQTKRKSKEIYFEPISKEESAEYLEESLEDELINTTESIDIDTYCRLCATNTSSNTCELLPIFDEKGQLHAYTECLKLMPNGLIVKDDGLPQYVCEYCLEKLQSCANIIDGFVVNQSLFVTE